jgi:hypothetical protein
MDEITIHEKARGQFLKILLAAAVIALAGWAYQNAPKSISHKVFKKRVVVNLTYLPQAAEALAALAALYMLYVVALAKTTKIEAGRINLSYTHGIFDRSRDAIDMTDIRSYLEEQTLIDMALMVYTFKIFSHDVTDPHLVIRGISSKDAAVLYEHLKVFTNHSIVKYVQSQPDRQAYREAHHAAEQEGEGGERGATTVPPDNYSRAKTRRGEERVEGGRHGRPEGEGGDDGEGND